MKVLIITPTPTHPAIAGNRKMVAYLSNFFKHAGCELHCIYIPFESYDRAAMAEFYGRRLAVPDKKGLYVSTDFLSRIKQGVISRIVRLKRKFQAFTGKINANDLQYNSSVDQHIPISVHEFVKKAAQENSFDIVVSEYVWVSALLSYFPPKTCKIISTHDRFTNRYKVYQAMGKEPEWVSLYEDEEARGLRRADIVLALNETERSYFEQISGIRAVLFGYVPPRQQLPFTGFRNTLLYFASANEINKMSLQWFLDEVWPALKAAHPPVKLLIGGRIAAHFSNTPKDVEITGEFENPSDFYKLGDIVINPELSGTGLKIKALEAISFGIPLVATTPGASGILQGTNQHILLADTATAFCHAIKSLCLDSDFRQELIKQGFLWLAKYEKQSQQGILQALAKEGIQLPVKRSL